MEIHVNTDRNLEGSEALVQMVEADVQSTLEHFADRLTRVEVHLRDENGEKDGVGDDKRCVLEARPSGMQPVVVTGSGHSFEQAWHDAARKMQSLLKSRFGRIDARGSDATIRQAEAT